MPGTETISILDLPADLLRQDGEWLQLTHKNINRIGLTHEMSRRGRSEFLLFVRFPSGRKQAEEYLKGHNDVSAVESRRRDAILNFRIVRNEAMPPSSIFPAGPQAVLLERMLPFWIKACQRQRPSPSRWPSSIPNGR